MQNIANVLISSLLLNQKVIWSARVILITAVTNRKKTFKTKPGSLFFSLEKVD